MIKTGRKRGVNGAKLRKAREREGIDQKGLALVAGVPLATVVRLEAHGLPVVSNCYTLTARKLARALGTSIAAFSVGI